MERLHDHVDVDVSMPMVNKLMVSNVAHIFNHEKSFLSSAKKSLPNCRLKTDGG